MGQDESKKEKKEAQESTITSQPTQTRQIHHVTKAQVSKEIIDQSFIHSQLNYIY